MGDLTLVKLSRNQVDVVLTAYCEQIGLSYSDLHDDAFCVQSKQGYWMHIWYDGDENCASQMIQEIEKLIENEKLNLVRTKS